MNESKSLGDKVFNITNVLIMLILMFLTLYPFWFSIVNSLNDGTDLIRGYCFFWPRQFTLASWRTVLADPSIMNAAWITASRTLIVTVVSIFNTAMFSYAFSRPYLKHKKFYSVLGFVSMYFSGGLIPVFMLFKWLGLYDNYLVYIIPSLFAGFFNVIIFNANFKAIPDSLFESAKTDGANEFTIFFRIVLPLSKPVLAALSVFVAVGIWNDYGTTLFFTQSNFLDTLQYFTLKLVLSSQAADHLKNVALQTSPELASLLSKSAGSGPVTSRTIELASMVLASLPMIIIYPFAQKFFVKGVMIGSIKG